MQLLILLLLIVFVVLFVIGSIIHTYVMGWIGYERYKFEKLLSMGGIKTTEKWFKTEEEALTYFSRNRYDFMDRNWPTMERVRPKR